MKITSEVVKVEASSYLPDGTKLEPEEKIVQRELGMQLPVTVGMGPNDPNLQSLVQTVSSTIQVNKEAHEVARSAASFCAHCKHFNQAAWHTLMQSWQHPLNREGKAQLDQLRGAVLEQNLKTDLLPEAIKRADGMLAQMGICEVLSETYKEPVIIAPTAGCPQEVGPNGEDLSQNFQIRDRETQKVASKSFDQIMHIAQGKVE